MRNQIYRGNPEQKLYTVVNNFSGGVNTTSVDEYMMSNEFRELINVELKEQGKVKNRKGFGHFNVFKELLEENNVTLYPEYLYDGEANPFFPDLLIYNKYPMFKVVVDTHNVFDRLLKASSLESFKSEMSKNKYELDIVYITATKISTTGLYIPLDTLYYVHLNHLKFRNTNQDHTVEKYEKNLFETDPVWMSISETTPDLTITQTSDDDQCSSESAVRQYVTDNYPVENYSLGYVIKVDTYKATLPVTACGTRYFVKTVIFNDTQSMEDGPDFPLKGITTIENDGKIYISLGDLTLDRKGFIEYNYENESLVYINEDNAYVPSPFEVSNVGFNLLLNNPLNVSLDASGVAQVRGMYLTDVNNNKIVLSSVPQSGIFNLNIIFKGSGLSHNDLKIDIYVENINGVKTNLDTEWEHVGSLNDGIITYRISTRIEAEGQLFISVKKIEMTEDFDISLISSENMVTYYKGDFGPFSKKVSLTETDIYVKSPAPKEYGYQLATCVSRSEDFFGTVYTASEKLAEKLRTVNYNSGTGEVTGDLISSYGTSLQHVLVRNVVNNHLHMGYCFYVAGVPYEVLTDPGDLYNKVEFENSGLEEFNLTTDMLIRTGSEGSYVYYMWKGTHVGDITDFNDVSLMYGVNEIISYTLPYRVSDEDNSLEMNPIDTSKISMIKINERLVLYSGNTVLFSEVNRFDYFPNYNYIVLPLNNDDRIQNISYFRGSWIIFTRDSIYRMSGTFMSEDFSITLLNDSLGCIAPLSVAPINNTLLFLSADGLYTIKQNFYMEGLENVDKVDKNIDGLITRSYYNEAFVVGEKYMLIVKTDNGSYLRTVKQYYNMQYKSNTYPYVVDIYQVEPDNLFKVNNELISIKGNRQETLSGVLVDFKDDIYIYDKGYTDFEPTGYELLPEERVKYMYKMTVLTPNYSMGYTTHDKKFKTIYLKTDSTKTIPVFVTIYLNNNVWLTPYQFEATINELGEIEYREILNKSTLTTTVEGENNLVLSEVVTDEQIIDTIDPELTLGSFTLGETRLGLDRYQVHKIVASGKGKIIAVKIEQKLDEELSITDLGFLYKLGKVKESR